MKAYQPQPSANEKASHAAQSNELPHAPPRIHRSQSANDASAGAYANYMYGDYYNAPPGGSPAHPTDAYVPYDTTGAYGYHRYAAEQAPTDEAAAYHQYHAQRAAMQHHTLAPIYDNATYNPQSASAYYAPHQQYNKAAKKASSKPQQRKAYDHTLYPPMNLVAKGTKQKRSERGSKKKESTDALPSAPIKLKHAATMPFHHSTDLQYELEKKQTEKQLKRVELENKRKEISVKNSLNKSQQKVIEETKKKWNLEREEIIKSYGGKIPSFIIESDKLRKDLENMSNRNSALQASLEVISSHLQSELYQLQYQLKFEKEISEQTHEHNIELERRVRELRIEKLELETELKTEKDKEFAIDANNVNEKNRDREKEVEKSEREDDDEEDTFREYPPESTVIQNLLQAQVEFYFSDYNLKRDKRLLSDVVKPPKKGFLRLDEVMKLSRIRQLCSEIETLEEALRQSNILTLIREKQEAEEANKADDEDNKEDEYDIYVGRLNFEKPREKEFPFRRTVFIFGIPSDGSSEFLHSMLKPFGSVSKIQFDHSPDGIDRKIGIRFLNKPRIYTLYYYDQNQYHDNELLMSQNREEMIFKTSYDISTDQMITNIKCHKCGKDKAVSEGFYTTLQWKVIYCAQCAAQMAEDQLNVYYKERNIPQYQHNPRHKWLGSPPNDVQKRKTALVVFASQRQASKCAYVRTRIAYKGAFATHFHHYSKVKKEIVLAESDQNDANNGNNTADGHGEKKKDENKTKDGKQNKGNYKQKRRQNNNNNNNANNNRRGRGRGRGRARGRGSNRYMSNNANSGFNNYAQQQAAYYQGQQPPQAQHQTQSNKPKIFRQSSAPPY